METLEIYSGIANAIEMTKPAQEYCLKFVSQTWRTCMTKAEWSGWMQAIFSVIAIIAVFIVATCQRRQALKDDQEKKISLLRACLKVVLDARFALNDVERKISGESKRPPSSSRARIDSLERTVQIILTKDIPEEAVKPLLIVLREIAYTKRAIDESSHRAPDPMSEASKKAESRTKVVALVGRALKKELEIQTASRFGLLKRRRSSQQLGTRELDSLG